jgi:hypothetical protein
VSYLWEMPTPPKNIQEEADLAVGLIESSRLHRS